MLPTIVNAGGERVPCARRLLAPGLAALALLLSTGCGGQEESASPSPPSPAAAPAPAPAASPVDATAEAKKIFDSRCVTCHGPEGGGDGPGSKGLSPAPRDFRDPAWQAEVSDDHIAKIIMYGGAAVGRSPTMPGNPDLSNKTEVVTALVTHIRALAN